MSKYGPVLLVLFFIFTPQLYSQSKPAQKSQSQVSQAEEESARANPDEARMRLQQQLVLRAMAERQTQLKLDAQQLFALAAELKERVDKTNPNVLSLEVVKKAQEIEKLAKSVKEKMRDAY